MIRDFNMPCFEPPVFPEQLLMKGNEWNFYPVVVRNYVQGDVGLSRLRTAIKLIDAYRQALVLVCYLGPFYWHGFTSIRARINKHIHCFTGHVITHPSISWS